jgi:hypothetical protein
MAMTPEARVKNMCKKVLTELGVWFFSPAANGYGRAGIPDFICCLKGRFLAVECKAGKGALTALQDREINDIHAHGGSAVVIREDGEQTLRTIVQAITDIEDMRNE